MTDVQIRHPHGSERERMDAIAAQAFSTAAPAAEPDRVDWTPPMHRRWVAAVDDTVAGKLHVWEMGHWLDGRCVPTAGVGGVAVEPAARGSGVARGLLSRLLHDLHEEGWAMSSLFPMNLPLYRKAGWEVAGIWPRHRVSAAALARLPAPSGPLRVRPSTLDDLDAVIAVYDEMARHEQGMLQRERIKCRRLVAPGAPGYGYVVERDGRIVGYVSYTNRAVEPGSDGLYDFDVTELVALDRDATLTLWRLLGSSAPAVRDVLVVLGPTDPLHLLLPERVVRREEEWWWMTRLVDLSAAVAARGWRPGASARIELDIADPVLEANDGPHVLTVSDGKGSLERGGGGRVRMGVGTLSSLFTGWADARRLRSAGLLPGADESAADALESVFGGRTPWVRTFF